MTHILRVIAGLIVAGWGLTLFMWMASPQLYDIPVWIIYLGNLSMIVIGVLMLPWRIWP